MARTRTKTEPVEAELKWDDSQKRWHAVAPGADGKPVSLLSRSTTKALRRMTKQLERDYGRPVPVEPKIHIPKPAAARFNEFSKKHQAYLALKEFVERERLELGSLLVYDFQMPILTVGPLLGLSSQRFGVMLAEYEASIGSSASKRAAANDDDEDEED